MKLYEQGKPNAALYEPILRNVRFPSRSGDLEAQRAAMHIGEREMMRLIARYGDNTVANGMSALLDYSERIVREDETADTGLPMMRSMWLHHPDDPAASARGDQFFWGRDLLVAPVVEKGATTRKIYLPKGIWFDFWTTERVEGGREIERAVTLETTPLYVRAGAVIPMGPVKQYVRRKSRRSAPPRRLSWRGRHGLRLRG